jgi:hypothetical protein
MRETPKYASMEDVQEVAQNWSDQFLECRTYGHHWRPQAATYTKDKRAISTVHVCRCDTERRSMLDARTGWVLSVHYVYPDGYTTKGLGRITGDAKGALRLAGVHRVFGVRPPKTRKRVA